MPKIRKTSKQEKALQTIVIDLKVVDRINSVIENVEILESGTVTVQADSAKVVLTFPSSAINKLLGDIRKDKIAEIKTLAKRYTITLDDDDEAIIEAGAKTSKSKAEPATQRVAEDESETEEETEDETDAELILENNNDHAE